MPRDRPSHDAFGRPIEPTKAPAAAPVRDRSTWTPRSAPVTPPGDPAPSPMPAAGTAPDSWSARGAAAPSTNPQAVIALAAGVLGFVLVPILLSVAAIVVGTSGVRRADALPGTPGRSMARIGRGLGWASLAFWGLLFLAALAYAA